MHIAFAGLASSHPFAIAKIAARSGAHRFTAWDADETRLGSFESRFHAQKRASLEQLLADRADVVIVTVQPGLSADVVGRALKSGAACYQPKVAAAHLSQADALDAAVAPHWGRYFTGSVLRFAPAITELRNALAPSTVCEVDVLVEHDIGIFLSGDRRWQDDPSLGGGTAISLGIHGWDIASALLGESLTAIGGSVSREHYVTASEDAAVLGAVTDSGIPVTVRIQGFSDVERYEVTVRTSDGASVTSKIGGGDEDVSLGYVACVDAVIDMAGGALAAVSWDQCRNVIETSIGAAGLARAEST